MLFLASVFAMLFISKWVTNSNSETIATSQFKEKNISTFISILIWASIQTSLSEEIFFRGFLLKRLSNKFGFTVGNIMQSLAFCVLHMITLFSAIGLLKALIVMSFTFFVAFLAGHLNEKEAGGSIIPSWLMHALANVLSCAMQIV